MVAKLPGGLRGSADLLVIDIFSGARTPAHVTSVEFYRSAAALLKASGVVLVNIADGPGLAFARGQAATLLAAVDHVAVLAEAQILKGRRYGNLVLVGSARAAAAGLDAAPAGRGAASGQGRLRPGTDELDRRGADRHRRDRGAVAAAGQERLPDPARPPLTEPSRPRSAPAVLPK